MTSTSRSEQRRVLIVGATGMLGNTLMRLFSKSEGMSVWGTVRRVPGAFANQPFRDRLIPGVDVAEFDTLIHAFAIARPDVVINCVGLVKQLAEADRPLSAIPVNSVLPHRLASLAEAVGARFVHVSTDCVFSGRKGMYAEDDFADAYDLYGRSKLLGEVDAAHAITLRTSIIGHELNSAQGLVEWFLSQQEHVRGFRKAIFSGLPTVELGRVIRDYVLPQAVLRGVYHVSAEPISKYDLLRLVAEVYRRSTRIIPDDEFVLDRSLDSSRFRTATGYSPPVWSELVRSMKDFG